MLIGLVLTTSLQALNFTLHRLLTPDSHNSLSNLTYSFDSWSLDVLKICFWVSHSGVTEVSGLLAYYVDTYRLFEGKLSL